MVSDLALPDPARIGDLLGQALKDAPDFDVAGHRVVHGGLEFTARFLLEPRIEGRLGKLAELAPLHNPPSIAAILDLQSRWPKLPQVAASTPRST